MIELLELLFGEIREFIESLDITLIELFLIMENDIVVGLIENEPPVSLLNRRVLLSVLLDIADIWRRGGCLMEWESDWGDDWHYDNENEYDVHVE